MTDYTREAPRTATIDYTEASTIGLAPGEWPRTIRYEGYAYIQTGISIEPDGDVIDARYEDDLGSVLIVVND